MCQHWDKRLTFRITQIEVNEADPQFTVLRCVHRFTNDLAINKNYEKKENYYRSHSDYLYAGSY